MSTAAGIPISVKVRQNFELRPYFADNCDCGLKLFLEGNTLYGLRRVA
jgi:hypothetical protein